MVEPQKLGVLNIISLTAACTTGAGCHGWQGNGKLIFSDGTMYIGGFHLDVREGIGSCTYASGDRYAGGWKNGQRHGKGRYTGSDGEKYTPPFAAAAVAVICMP